MNRIENADLINQSINLNPGVLTIFEAVLVSCICYT